MDAAALRQGTYVTAGYILVFYGFIIGQAVTKTRLQKSYTERGERVSQP